jgi:hypothetical protein
MKALLALLDCPPTTLLLGVLAALEHVGKPEWLAAVGASGTRETNLSGLNDSSIDDVRRAVRRFPLRLAAALQEIIGHQMEGRGK